MKEVRIFLRPPIKRKGVKTMAISMMKLQDIMNEKGLKKYDLRKAGFNPNIIDKVLSGVLNKSKRVDTETINRLCKYLDCQPADIMEYVEDNE